MPKAKVDKKTIDDDRLLKLLEGEKALAEQRAQFEAEKALFEQNNQKAFLKPSELPVHEVEVMKDDLTKHIVKIKEQVIKNTRGENVPVADYFFAGEGETAVAPGFFNKSCGFPVDREDLIEVFNRIFKPEDNFVLLKTNDKEIYGVLVPLKFATMVSKEDESRLGDCQYHAISFIMDGSVNVDKFEGELEKIAKLIGYDRR